VQVESVLVQSIIRVPMSDRDRRKLRDTVGRIQVIREKLQELEGADEGIVRLVAHSAGQALNWIALAGERPETKHFDSCCRAIESIDLEPDLN